MKKLFLWILVITVIISYSSVTYAYPPFENPNIVQFEWEYPKLMPVTIWHQCIGTGWGKELISDHANVVQNSEGNFVIAGFGSIAHSETELYQHDWVILCALTPGGDIIWEKEYELSYAESHHILEYDDSYLFVIWEDGNVHFYQSDKSGNINWINQFIWGHDPDDDWDEIYCIEETVDGKIIGVGQSDTNNNNTPGWVVKSGNTMDWQDVAFDKMFWGNPSDPSCCSELYKIRKTADGGYICCGYCDMEDTWEDFWILKLDASGNREWQKLFGGDDSDIAYDIQPTDDDMDGNKNDGYIVIGYAKSDNGDVPDITCGSENVWVLKLDLLGNIEWSKCYGGWGKDIGYSICQADDGSYVFIGNTSSIAEEDSHILYKAEGDDDIWVVNISPTGQFLKQMRFGGLQDDYGRYIEKTDKGFVILGYTESPEVEGFHPREGLENWEQEADIFIAEIRSFPWWPSGLETIEEEPGEPEIPTPVATVGEGGGGGGGCNIAFLNMFLLMCIAPLGFLFWKRK